MIPNRIDPETARRTLASVLINHDSVSDLIILAATVADESDRTVTLASLRADLLADGYGFDDDGWLDASPFAR